MTSIVTEEWIGALVSSLATVERAPEVTEVLSDASGEQYLNALTARSLRGFWRTRGRTGFWVRSEWAKTDISYGEATKPFEHWDAAWRARESGDLGQIEAKVVYSHYSSGERAAKLRELSRQLESRRSVDQHHLGADAALQRYHGLVWLYHHGGGNVAADQAVIRHASDAIAETAKAHALVPALQGALFRDVASAELGDLWPTGPRNYVGRLSLAVVTLPT